jgi:hypothetical protein
MVEIGVSGCHPCRWKETQNRIIGVICPFFVKCPSITKMNGRGGGIEIASLQSKSRERNDVAPPPLSNWSLLESNWFFVIPGSYFKVKAMAIFTIRVPANWAEKLDETHGVSSGPWFGPSENFDFGATGH